MGDGRLDASEVGQSTEAPLDCPEAAITQGLVSPGCLGEVYEVRLWGAAVPQGVSKLLWSGEKLVKKQRAVL